MQDRIRVLAAVECGLGIGVAAAEIFLRAGRVFGEMQQACRQRGVKHIHRGPASRSFLGLGSRPAALAAAPSDRPVRTNLTT